RQGDESGGFFRGKVEHVLRQRHEHLRGGWGNLRSGAGAGKDGGRGLGRTVGRSDGQSGGPASRRRLPGRLTVGPKASRSNLRTACSHPTVRPSSHGVVPAGALQASLLGFTSGNSPSGLTLALTTAGPGGTRYTKRLPLYQISTGSFTVVLVPLA